MTGKVGVVCAAWRERVDGVSGCVLGVDVAEAWA